jgi:hypothetical protein
LAASRISDPVVEEEIELSATIIDPRPGDAAWAEELLDEIQQVLQKRRVGLFVEGGRCVLAYPEDLAATRWRALAEIGAITPALGPLTRGTINWRPYEWTTPTVPVKQ